MKTISISDVPLSVVYDILYKAITHAIQFSGGGTHTSIKNMVPNEEIIVKRKQHAMWLTSPTEINFTAFIRFKKEKNSTIITWDTQYHWTAMDYFGMAFFLFLGAVFGAIGAGLMNPALIVIGILVGAFLAYGFVTIIDNSVTNGVYDETYSLLIQNPLNQIKHIVHKQKEAMIQGSLKFE